MRGLVLLVGAMSVLASCGVTFSPYIGMPFDEFRYQCNVARADVPHVSHDENGQKIHFCDDRSQQFIFEDNKLVEIR